MSSSTVSNREPTQPSSSAGREWHQEQQKHFRDTILPSWGTKIDRTARQVDDSGEPTSRRWDFYEYTSAVLGPATVTYSVLMSDDKEDPLDRGIRQVWYKIGKSEPGDVPPYKDSSADTGIKFELGPTVDEE